MKSMIFKTIEDDFSLQYPPHITATNRWPPIQPLHFCLRPTTINQPFSPTSDHHSPTIFKPLTAMVVEGVTVTSICGLRVSVTAIWMFVWFDIVVMVVTGPNLDLEFISTQTSVEIEVDEEKDNVGDGFQQGGRRRTIRVLVDSRKSYDKLMRTQPFKGSDLRFLIAVEMFGSNRTVELVIVNS